MIAIIERPSGFAAGGGFDVSEPEIAYDAFVALVRGLLDLGYAAAIVARWARRRWKALLGPEVYERMPLEVERLLGDASRRAMLDSDAEDRRAKDRCYRRHKRTGRRRQFDRDAIRADIRAGMTDREIAAKHGCHKVTVRQQRGEIGLARPIADVRDEALSEALRGLARYTALRQSGLSLDVALREIGADRTTLRRWQSRERRHREDAQC